MSCRTRGIPGTSAARKRLLTLALLSAIALMEQSVVAQWPFSVVLTGHQARDVSPTQIHRSYGTHTIFFWSDAPADGAFGVVVLQDIERLTLKKYKIKLGEFHLALWVNDKSRSSSTPSRLAPFVVSEGVDASAAIESPTSLGIDGLPVSLNRYEEEAVSVAMSMVYRLISTRRVGAPPPLGSTPEWFSEGLPFLDGKLARTGAQPAAVRAEMIAWKNGLGKDVSCCGSSGTVLSFPRVPAGGASFLAFLAERFGEDLHRRLVVHDLEDFRVALAREIRPRTLEEVVLEYQLWR